MTEMYSELSVTDPEWVEVVSNSSLDEVVKENKLTNTQRMLCILSALLGLQAKDEFKNMLHMALKEGV